MRFDEHVHQSGKIRRCLLFPSLLVHGNGALRVQLDEMSLEQRFRTLDVHQPRLDVVVEDLRPIGEVGENIRADFRRSIIAEKMSGVKAKVVVGSLDFPDSRNSDGVLATIGITDRFADATHIRPERLGHVPESDVGGHRSPAPSRRITKSVSVMPQQMHT